MPETQVIADEWDVEHSLSVELDDGRVMEATGETIAEALRRLADAVETAQEEPR